LRRRGIPAGNVLISASHAHSAPFKTIAEPGLFDGAPDDIRDLAYREYSCPSPDYVDFAVRQIAAAVSAADRDRTEANAQRPILLCEVALDLRSLWRSRFAT